MPAGGAVMVHVVVVVVMALLHSTLVMTRCGRRACDVRIAALSAALA
jgi:hypothetical protein